MSFKNNPRFTADVDQKIRERLARSRNSFQTLTRGIYPESSGIRSESIDQNSSETNRIDQERSVKGSMAVQVSPDPSTTPENESSKICQDLSTPPVVRLICGPTALREEFIAYNKSKELKP